MKKTLLTLVMSSSMVMAFAQQRMVLAESFSQASCGPCASQNPAFTTLLDANTSKIVAVKYQVSWPGYDPMYLQNPTEIDARSTYYSISGVPARVMDGTEMTIDQTAINSRYAVASPVNMTISHTISADFATADITVTITAPGVWNPSNTVLQLALIEKEIIFASAPGSNGETEFHNVMRKMYPSASGTPVVASNFSSAGGTQTFTFNDVAIPSYIYNIGEIGFVAWVQDNTSKEVHQAGISEPITLSDYGIVNALTVPNYSCATDVTGAIAVLKNQGNTTITSATVNYKVDNGTVQTAAFSGSIAPGATSNFTLPTFASTSGSHVLTTYLSNINGSGLSTAIGTKTSNFATISAAGTTGAFTQNFTGSSFPYANYYTSSATSDNWVRSTANTGSLKYNCFSYASGKTGSAFIAPIDMTSIPSHFMTFDVAYRQYASENDALSVLVSTDCGQNWTSVYSKSGSTLSTGAAQTTGFTPSTANDWRNESVDLSAYASATKLHIKFVGLSNYGNNMYVDNINLGTTGLTTLEEKQFAIFPNPTSDNLTVSFEAENTDYTISVLDLTGRTVVSNEYSNLSGSQLIAVPVSGLSTGNYIVKISTNGTSFNQKVVIE